MEVAVHVTVPAPDLASLTVCAGVTVITDVPALLVTAVKAEYTDRHVALGIGSDTSRSCWDVDPRS